MQFDFKCLLTKSYSYQGSFESVVRRICNAVCLKKNKNDFFADSIPVNLFYKNQTIDNTACYLDSTKAEKYKEQKKLDFNFIVIPLTANIFRHHFIEQAKEAKQFYKQKIIDLSEARSNSISLIKGNATLVKTLNDVNKYCLQILDYKKYTANEERSDGILKSINRLAIHLNSVYNEKYNKTLEPFIETIKFTRKYLSFLKFVSLPGSFDSLSGFVLTICRNGILSISMMPIYKIDKKNCDFVIKSYWVSKAYKDSNEINGLLDSLSLMYDHIDLNRVFGLDDNKLILSKNDSEVKRAVFGKMSFEKSFFERYWLKPFDNFKDEFCNIKSYFSLMSTNLFLYRDISYTTQKQIIEKQINKTDINFALKSCPPYFNNNNISDYDNLFCRSNRSVFLTSSYAYFETEDLNKFDSEKHDHDDWFINKIVNNHRHRFVSDVDASVIFTSIVYSSMFSMSQIILRDKIEGINTSNNHLARLFRAHEFVTFYEKNICIFSSHGPFIKDDTARLSAIVFKANRIREQENDTELFVKNLWQESNLSNGKIFPLIQAFVAIITLVCLIFNITNSCDGNLIFSYVGAGACIILLLMTCIFVAVNHSKK